MNLRAHTFFILMLSLVCNSGSARAELTCAGFFGAIMDASRTAGDNLKLSSYDLGIKYSWGRKGDANFDKIVRVFEQGRVAQGQVEEIFLRNWFDFSAETQEKMVQWFGKYGNSRSISRLENEILNSTNQYITNTQAYLFESLLEISLRHGPEAHSYQTEKIFKNVEGYWLRKYFLSAIERAAENSETYSTAELKLRQKIFAGFDYGEQKAKLENLLDRKRDSELESYLYSGIADFGLAGHLNIYNDGFMATLDRFADKPESLAMRSPYTQFLIKAINGRLGRTNALNRADPLTVIDAISITLNWMALHPKIWTPELKSEFINMTGALKGVSLELIASSRPELSNMLKVKSTAELDAILARPRDLAPQLISLRDLHYPSRWQALMENP